MTTNNIQLLWDKIKASNALYYIEYRDTGQPFLEWNVEQESMFLTLKVFVTSKEADLYKTDMIEQGAVALSSILSIQKSTLDFLINKMPVKIDYTVPMDLAEEYAEMSPVDRGPWLQIKAVLLDKDCSIIVSDDLINEQYGVN